MLIVRGTEPECKIDCRRNPAQNSNDSFSSIFSCPMLRGSRKKEMWFQSVGVDQATSLQYRQTAPKPRTVRWSGISMVSSNMCETTSTGSFWRESWAAFICERALRSPSYWKWVVFSARLFDVWIKMDIFGQVVVKSKGHAGPCVWNAWEFTGVTDHSNDLFTLGCYETQSANSFEHLETLSYDDASETRFSTRRTLVKRRTINENSGVSDTKYVCIRCSRKPTLVCRLWSWREECGTGYDGTQE